MSIKEMKMLFSTLKAYKALHLSVSIVFDVVVSSNKCTESFCHRASYCSFFQYHSREDEGTKDVKEKGDIKV